LMRKFAYLIVPLMYIAFALVLIPVPLCSQTYLTFQSESARIRENAKWNLGPFRIFPSLQLRNIGYDNNIYQMRKDDNPVSDYTATVSLPFNFYVPYRNRIIISLDISPGYDFFLNEVNQRGINFDFSPGARLLFFNRFVLSGSYQYQKRRQRPNIEFAKRIFMESKAYEASLFYETVLGTAFGFSGLVNRFAYEDTEGDISYSRALNREERSGNFEFYYKIFMESDFFLSAGYLEYNFDDSEFQWRNSYSYSLRSGIRFPILGTARGTLSLGYRWLINRSDNDKRFSGIIGNTSLDLRLGRFNLRLQYVRDFQFSYSYSYLYFIENRIGTGISFYVTQFLRIDYDFSYREGKYPKESIFQLQDYGNIEIERENEYLTHSAGLVFRLIGNTGIGLTVTYWERDSNVEGVGRKGAFIGGYLAYDF
jgi:hypothetical protein